jgi:hypothetical protein
VISAELGILNVGLPLIVEAATNALTLDWRPPAWGNAEIARSAVHLDNATTQAANAAAVAEIHAARPVLTRIRPARSEIAGFGDGRLLLHAGPPIEAARMCGPMMGALIGAALFEEWATSPDEARRALLNGEIRVEPCHHHGAVGPMAGVLAPSMPVLVTEWNGRATFASLNEGLGKVLRFGAFDDEVLNRLRWMRDVLGPVLDIALQLVEPIDVTGLIGQALTMGDEGHNRNVAATALFTRRLAPVLAGLEHGADVLSFLAGNDHFTLNLSMASAKLAMDCAHGIADSTIVVAMARNGVEFGLRVAGTGDRWFTAPVGPADGLFFPGYSIDDANPDLGDSAITETLGIGGFAMASAPAITRFVGGTPADALDVTRQMRRITITGHPAFQIPSLGFASTPSGIDVLKVIETNILPVINTGIAHKEAGVGQIGAGVVRAPAEVFVAAVRGLSELRQS